MSVVFCAKLFHVLSLFLVGAFGGSYMWNDLPDTENRLLTCWFYKLSLGRSVLVALVTGLLQSLKCKENKCSKLSISLKPCRQWAKYCGIVLVNSVFCGFALCLWIRQNYLFKDSASGFDS